MESATVKSQDWVASEIHGFCGTGKETRAKQEEIVSEKLVRLYRVLAPLLKPLDTELDGPEDSEE